MITSFKVSNFKSLLDVTIEPGSFNVFIGANGCGKSNILEALALTAGALTQRTTPEDLYNRGYRVARPAITRSAFDALEPRDEIQLTVSQGDGERAESVLTAADEMGIASPWFDHEEGVRVEPVGAAVAISSEEKRRVEARHRARRLLEDFVIYTPSTLALRGIQVESRRTPIGIHGEGVDLLVASLPEADRELIASRLRVIDWFDDVFVDADARLKFQGHKLGRSVSNLYFRDRFMGEQCDVFSVENANEGILHLLFHLSLFVSAQTPKVFGIDNLDTALNPQLCRLLTESLAALAAERGKQAFVTTHNPAILDGLNLHDDRQRLFVVSRDGDGHTRVKRVTVKPDAPDGKKYKLSELWMRGHLGGLPDAF